MKLHDVLVLVGSATTVAGIALYSWKLAVVVAGLLILSVGIRLARTQKAS